MDIKLLVGGSGHIGSELAKCLDATGQTIVVVDKSPPKYRYLKYVEIDLAKNPASIRTLPVLLTKLYPNFKIEMLVYCASFVGSDKLPGWSVRFEEQNLDLCHEVNNVGFLAFVQLVQELHIKDLFKVDSPIIALSSIYSETPVLPDLYESDSVNFYMPLLYGATKAALNYSIQYLGTVVPNLRFNAILLGGVFREQPEDFIIQYCTKTALGKMLNEKNIAEFIVFLCSPDASSIRNQLINYDAGFRLDKK